MTRETAHVRVRHHHHIIRNPAVAREKLRVSRKRHSREVKGCLADRRSHESRDLTVKEPRKGFHNVPVRCVPVRGEGSGRR